VTVAMSDSDYAILLAAVGWIEHHGGKDCPPYPGLDLLTHVVDNISRRREATDGPPPPSFGEERILERRRLRRFDPAVHDSPR
jgi:hypothetical protein